MPSTTLLQNQSKIQQAQAYSFKDMFFFGLSVKQAIDLESWRILLKSNPHSIEQLLGLESNLAFASLSCPEIEGFFNLFRVDDQEGKNELAAEAPSRFSLKDSANLVRFIETFPLSSAYDSKVQEIVENLDTTNLFDALDTLCKEYLVTLDLRTKSFFAQRMIKITHFLVEKIKKTDKTASCFESDDPQDSYKRILNILAKVVLTAGCHEAIGFVNIPDLRFCIQKVGNCSESDEEFNSKIEYFKNLYSIEKAPKPLWRLEGAMWGIGDLYLFSVRCWVKSSWLRGLSSSIASLVNIVLTPFRILGVFCLNFVLNDLAHLTLGPSFSRNPDIILPQSRASQGACISEDDLDKNEEKLEALGHRAGMLFSHMGRWVATIRDYVGNGVRCLFS